MADEEQTDYEEGPESGGSEALNAYENELRSVDSTMVSEIGFDEEAGEIQVIFNNGSEHTYPADKAKWDDLKGTPSVGRWLWDNFLG